MKYVRHIIGVSQILGKYELVMLKCVTSAFTDLRIDRNQFTYSNTIFLHTVRFNSLDKYISYICYTHILIYIQKYI